jgi:hypothetical protein
MQCNTTHPTDPRAAFSMRKNVGCAGLIAIHGSPNYPTTPHLRGSLPHPVPILTLSRERTGSLRLLMPFFVVPVVTQPLKKKERGPFDPHCIFGSGHLASPVFLTCTLFLPACDSPSQKSLRLLCALFLFAHLMHAPRARPFRVPRKSPFPLICSCFSLSSVPGFFLAANSSCPHSALAPRSCPLAIRPRKSPSVFPFLFDSDYAFAHLLSLCVVA